jgi:hypothetical protein
MLRDYGVSPVALSLAAQFAEGEDEAFVLDFTDDYFVADTGFYGSAYVKDNT